MKDEKMTYNVGLFGDSYANCPSPHEDQKEWHEYLDVFCNKKCNVDNYGVAGSSLYFSYQHFKKHHQKYDKVIFLYTAPNRLWMPQYWDKQGANGEHIHNVDCANQRFEKGTPFQKILKDAVNKYYVYLNNVQEHKDYWELMIDDIRRTRKDALVLPCFYKSKNEKQWPLVQISKIDDAYYGLNIMEEGIEYRANHFNKENSKIFGLKVANWISTRKFKHSIKMYKKPEFENGLGIYYDKR